MTGDNRVDVHIHPTAVVHDAAKIGKGTRIGPFCVVGENVVLGDDCDVQEHVVLRGHTQIGNRCAIFPFSVIGGEPQHLKYQGEPTTVIVGDDVILRESVTIHRGTSFGLGKTEIGNKAFIMAYAHVAHDCVVGNNVIICNAVQLAGHVTIEDCATIGGASEIAQHCRVGRYCYVAGGSTLRKDLPPFLTGKGNEFQVQGINAVGMTRQGFQTETVQRLKALYKIFYMQNLTVAQAIERATQELGDSPEIKMFLGFIQGSKMGFIR